LLAVAEELRELGFAIRSGAVRFFPADGGSVQISDKARAMGFEILILEDNAERGMAMLERMQDRFPQFVTRIARTSGSMIQLLERAGDRVHGIALDHDLEDVCTGESRFDAGDGRRVADYLAKRWPLCPVIVHTTNLSAGDGMERVLSDAGWEVTRITPYGHLDWIHEMWFAAMRAALLREPSPGTMPTANSQEPVDQIIRLLLKLTAEDRLQIAECMVCSGAQAEIDEAWKVEIEPRITEDEAARSRSYPAEQVMAELRELVQRSRP
jgi:putative addiction module component (TIGR02574 family)